MFTSTQLKKEVINLLKSNGDNIYMAELCKYTQGECSNGKEGCVMGQALLNLNPNLYSFLENVDSRDFHDDIGSILMELAEEKFIEMNEDIGWFDTVQYYNDKHESWGSILKKVKDE